MNTASTATRSLICNLMLLVCFSAVAQQNDSTLWFHKTVTWQAGNDPRPWETTIVSPNGKTRYRLAFVPLWAVEGGIVGMEIVVAHPERPDQNLLGERRSHESQRFVVTVEELEKGIKQSPFGAERVFNVAQARLQVKITGWRLGKGVGDCATCDNIQEFTSELTFESK